MNTKNIRLSVLDQSPVRKGVTAEQAVKETIELAKYTDQLGYTRFWVSEHHNTGSLAGSTPEVLMAYLASQTTNIRIGSGGVMMPNHSALKVAENFRMLEALAPGRIDLGMGRAPGTDRLTASVLNPSNQFREQDFIEQLYDLRNFFHDTGEPGTPVGRIRAIPQVQTVPDMWLLSSSGQSGLFGDSHAGVAPIRLPKTEHWSLAQRMAAEREAFGFYFSAHPVDRYSQLARAHGARPLAEQPVPADGSRSTGKMAAMVEEARWRTSAKGRRYLVATLSDTSGQFVASVFDEEVAKSVEAAARNGDCMLLSVEMDRRPGEDAPRVAIRSLTPLDRLTANARLILHAEAADEVAARALAMRLRAARGGRGTVHLDVRAADGKLVPLTLGRDFLLDAELVAEVERIDGVSGVELSAETSVLALAS